MYQGMAYDYLTDPTGGQRVYQNPMLSPGMIAMDLGLTLGHGWIAKGMQASERSYLRHALSHGLGDAETMVRFGARPRDFNSQKRINKVKGRIARHYNNELGGLDAKYARASRTMKGIGWFAAIAGLTDLGFSLASNMASPGVSREARDRDRQALSNSEGMLDTRMAYTQRQRAIQAIHDSQISVGRSMIGQESSYLHR